MDILFSGEDTISLGWACLTPVILTLGLMIYMAQKHLATKEIFH